MHMKASQNGKIEVVTSVERRRRFSDGEKVRLVAETHSPGCSVAAVAKEHGLSQSLLYSWRRAADVGRLAAAPVASMALASASRASDSPFIRVQASTPEAPAFRITFPNGVLLDAPVGVDPQRIAAVMRAIHDAC
jgi:transposase